MIDANMVKDAPPSTGGIIKLQPFVGCNVVIQCTGEQQTKKTRFGDKFAVSGILHSADATVEGLMYSGSITGGMKSGENYAGRVEREGMGYKLVPLTKDELAKLVAAINKRQNSVSKTAK